MNPPRRELIVAAAGLLLAAALVFGPQVANGGLYWDDWQNAANVHFTREPGLLGALEQATGRPVFGYRPVLTMLLVIQYEAVGAHSGVLLGLAALYGATTAWALFLLLRTLGLATAEAAAPALLLLVFPWTDSTRMWNTASFDTLAVTFYLLGLVVAIRALRAPKGRRRVLLTAGSLALYLAAAWTYEIVAIAVACSVAVYLLVAPRRDALRRFGLDAVVAALAITVVAIGTTRSPLPVGEQLEHARTIAYQAFGLLARALIPVGEDVPGRVGAVVLVAVVVAALVARRPELRRWLAAVGLGALGVAAGYLLFVPAARYYEPLSPGTINRMNVLAAVGYAVLVCALVRLAAAMLYERRGALAAGVVLAAIAVGYVVQVRDDQAGWRESAEAQERILDAVRTSVPDPPPGATIYTFEANGFVAPGIPAFSLSFDLNSAVRLEYDDASLAAYPVRGLDVIRCDADSLQPVGGTYGDVHGARYGEAWFVNVPRRSAVRISSEAECKRWASLLSAA